MIYIKLMIDFFIVGILSFGGAYSAIPLIKDVASHYEIITDEMLVDFIAIAESTPGPVAVNLATFVGSYFGGIHGVILATLAEILPAFIIILVFTLFFKNLLKNDKVSYALSIIRPCIIGIITSVGLFLLYSILNKAIVNKVKGLSRIEFSTIIIAILLLAIMLLYQRLTKRKLSAIKIIIFGAVLGMAINYVL